MQLQYALKTLRLRAGLSQVKLAKKLGVSKATICKSESTVSNPAWATILRYLEGCDASVVELFEEFQEPREPPSEVVVADSDEVLRGTIQQSDGTYQLRVEGRMIQRAGTVPELLAGLPQDVQVYGLM